MQSWLGAEGGCRLNGPLRSTGSSPGAPSRSASWALSVWAPLGEVPVRASGEAAVSEPQGAESEPPLHKSLRVTSCQL